MKDALLMKAVEIRHSRWMLLVPVLAAAAIVMADCEPDDVPGSGRW